MHVISISFTGEPSDEYRDLTYSKSDGIETYANGTLYIQSVTQSHEGYFLCQAKNEIGAGLSKLIRLTVHGKKIHLIQFHGLKSSAGKMRKFLFPTQLVQRCVLRKSKCLFVEMITFQFVAKQKVMFR